MIWSMVRAVGLCLFFVSVSSLAIENFLVSPDQTKKKSPSKAALADEVEGAMRDMLASCNRISQHALQVQEYYLKTIDVLSDGDVAVEKEDLSRLLTELQRVQPACDAIERNFVTIKKETAKSKKTVPVPAEPTHKKGA